jgi:methylmalonyl-CoA epimerase
MKRRVPDPDSLSETRPEGPSPPPVAPTSGRKAPTASAGDDLCFPAALDHIGIAVPSIERALAAYAAILGLKPGRVEEVPSERVRVAFLPLAAGGAIELLEPMAGTDSPVGRFLEKRGPGVHHLSFRVSDCRAAIRSAERAGIRALPPAPRPGSRGRLVAFFDPRDTGGVLIEICEWKPGPDEMPTTGAPR